MATSKIVELNESNICKLCDNALARYSCPRCDIQYCSLPCYRSDRHLECSESFYKDCIVEELSTTTTDKNESSKAKMLEILKRNEFNEQLDSDDEEFEELSDRLAGVNLDDADSVWEKLTEDEKQEFLAFLKTQDVTKLIPPWTPWWQLTTPKVEEVGNETKIYPTIVKIGSLKELCSKKPADCVEFNLINIVGAYVFTVRYFNGEHFDFPKEATTCMITISSTLKNNQNFPNIETAIKSVEIDCINSEWIMVDKENFSKLQSDLEVIQKGPESKERNLYLLYALSDVQKLFNLALKPNGDETTNFSQNFPNQFPDVKMESNGKIRNAMRKIDYFLAYVNECYK